MRQTKRKAAKDAAAADGAKKDEKKTVGDGQVEKVEGAAEEEEREE